MSLENILFFTRASLLPGWWGKVSTPMNQRVLAEAGPYRAQHTVWQMICQRVLILYYLIPKWPALEVGVNNRTPVHPDVEPLGGSAIAWL